MVPCCSEHDAGTGRVWLDSVSCMGTEDSLTLCDNSGLGQDDRGHSIDVGIRCDRDPPTTTTLPTTTTTTTGPTTIPDVGKYVVQSTVKVPFEAALPIEAAVGLEGQSLVESVYKISTKYLIESAPPVSKYWLLREFMVGKLLKEDLVISKHMSVP